MGRRYIWWIVSVEWLFGQSNMVWLIRFCTLNADVVEVWCEVYFSCSKSVWRCSLKWWYGDMREWWKLIIMVVWIPLWLSKLACVANLGRTTLKGDALKLNMVKSEDELVEKDPISPSCKYTSKGRVDWLYCCEMFALLIKWDIMVTCVICCSLLPCWTEDKITCIVGIGCLLIELQAHFSAIFFLV